MTKTSRIPIYPLTTSDISKHYLPVNVTALKPNGAFDFRDNERVAYEAKGSYSTELHTLRVQEIIKKRKKAVPFFIYMAYQNAHAPFEAKQR